MHVEKAVSVPFCVRENGQKGFRRNFSLVPVSTNDFPHVIVMLCCVFDHKSWLLAPNLTISFLSWDYQYVFFCVLML